MLTYEDVLELSELNDDEVDAIAAHEGIPEICAAEYGYYLCHTPDGLPRLHRIFLDDLAVARSHGDLEAVRRLTAVLAAFARNHPDPA